MGGLYVSACVLHLLLNACSLLYVLNKLLLNMSAL